MSPRRGQSLSHPTPVRAWPRARRTSAPRNGGARTRRTCAAAFRVGSLLRCRSLLAIDAAGSGVGDRVQGDDDAVATAGWCLLVVVSGHQRGQLGGQLLGEVGTIVGGGEPDLHID